MDRAPAQPCSRLRENHRILRRSFSELERLQMQHRLVVRGIFVVALIIIGMVCAAKVGPHHDTLAPGTLLGGWNTERLAVLRFPYLIRSISRPSSQFCLDKLHYLQAQQQHAISSGPLS